MANLEVRDLVLRAQGGDREAYDALYQRFRNTAFAYAYSILGDRDLAEDARQEAFVDAYCDLLTLKEPAAFPGWLRTIVCRHSIRIRRNRKTLYVPLEDLEDFAERGRPGAEEIVNARETRKAVRQAVSRLPDKEREAATLFYLEEIPIRELPARIGAPLSAVKNRLHAARVRLRRELMNLVKNTVQKQRRAGRKEAVHAASLAAVSLFDAELRELMGPPSEEQRQRICDLICAKGRLLRFMGRPDQAVAAFEEGLAAPILRENALLMARLKTEIGLTHIHTSRFETARTELDATRKTLSGPSQKSALMAAILNGMGTCAWSTGDYSDARRFFEKTVQAAQAASCPDLETEALQNLALLDWRAGRLVEALEKLRQCLRQWKRLDNRFEWVLALMNNGVLEENLGRAAVARRHYEQALAAAEDLNYLQVQAASLTNLANLNLSEKRWRKAEENSLRAVEIAKKIGDRRSEAIALENLALAQVGLARYEEAARVLRDARKIAAATGDRERLLSLDLAEIEMFLAQGRRDGVLEKLSNAARALEKNGYRAELPRLLRLRAQAEFATGDETSARKVLEHALEVCRRQKNGAEEKRLRILDKAWDKKLKKMRKSSIGE